MKRSNGEGTIFKRKDGRWCGAYYDDAPHPKRHFVYGSTQKEVKEKLKEKMKNPSAYSREKKYNYTLEEWMLFFLENYKKNDLKKTTFDTYMVMYRKHIKNSAIGNTKLNRLTNNQLQQYYNTKIADGYNPKTVKHIHVIVNAALDKAVQMKLITDNVNKLTSLPKRTSYEGSVLSAEEVKIILNESKEELLYPIVVLAIYTGLRKGEIMALKWKDVDLEKKELSVSGSLCRVEKESDESGKIIHSYEIMEPKTSKSRRTIPLLDVAIEALLLQKERQDKIKRQYKDIYYDEGFVFARYDGKYLNQRQFMNDYHAFLKKYNISNIRFHDLRHTFATLLLEAGEAPKIIQELLGHSTITTTMDIYAHVSTEVKQKTIHKLDSLFGLENSKKH